MTNKPEYNVYVEFSILIPKSSLLNTTHFSLPILFAAAEPYHHVLQGMARCGLLSIYDKIHWILHPNLWFQKTCIFQLCTNNLFLLSEV